MKLRLFAVALGAVALAASRSVVPLYAARPPVLLGGAGLAWGPGAVTAALGALGALLVALLLETLLRRRFLGLDARAALGESLRTDEPLAMLALYAVLFFPGLPFVPTFVYWLLLDGSPWLLTVVALAVLARKRALLPARLRVPTWGGRLAARALLAGGLLVLLLLWTPHRRFAETYDERWGTGDEPRYVRIAASLLHDGDADVANARELVGKRASLSEFVVHVAQWVPASLREASEAAGATFGHGRPGRARLLGGPVLEGRRGGVYYSFLPGFPLLLVPAMAVDSWLDPHHLTATLLTCMLLAAVLVVLLERLVEPILGSAAAAFALAAVLALSLPLFFYFFQVYTEVSAAIGLAVVLSVLLREETGFRDAVLFGLACGYLPWLHGKYLPLWGVAAIAYAVKTRFTREAALGLALAGAGLATNSLYVFHVTGSLLPDALWTLRGYDRGASLVSASTIPGLHHLFLSRDEGLFVYAPHLLLVLPGLVSLGRRSRFALATCVGLAVPYVLAAASHDQGGAGAWSPPARYLLPLLPVFAIALAAWLAPAETRGVRWALLLAGAAASFWTAQAMLGERHFPYDRPALLASGFVDPSPLLASSSVGSGLLLALLVAALLLAARAFRSSPARLLALVVAAVLLAGGSTALWTGTEGWIPGHSPAALRLRSSRPRVVQLPDCEDGLARLRFRGTSGVEPVRLRGPGWSAELLVPSGAPTELPVEVAPIRYWSAEGPRDVPLLSARLAGEEHPVDVQAICR